MKRILIIIANMFLSSFMMTIFAQLPNEEITILKTPNNDQSLTISCPEIPDACYQWSGPGVPSGAHTPSIVVYPQLDENVYHVVRTSKYGCEEKYVTVNVVECVSVDVRPLVECYPSGATVNRNDFIIKTSPPGYEDLVTVTPDHVSNVGVPVETEDITFSIMHDRACEGMTVSINVINDDFGNDSLDDTHQVSIEFENLLRTIETVQDELNYYERKLAKFVKPNGYMPTIGVCVPVISLTFNRPSYQAIKSCCEGNIGNGYKAFFQGLNGTVGVECNIPLSWLVPAGVAIPSFLNPVKVVVGLNAFIYIHDASIKHVSIGCTDMVVPFKVGFSAYGGARLDLIKVLSGSVRIVGTAERELLWDISKPFRLQAGLLRLSIALVIDASFMNFFKYKYTCYFAELEI